MCKGRLENQTAVITGAASGIGRAIARRFAEDGATVIVADVQREPKQGEHFQTDETRPTDKMINEVTDSEASYIETDVKDPAAANQLIEQVTTEFGPIDTLVNNAGIEITGTSQEISIEDWDIVLDVNLSGVFYCSKFAIPHLKETEGNLINIASVMAMEGGNGPPYSSSKAGVVNLTRDLAVELGSANVNVNAICPGYIKTPIQDGQTQKDIDAARKQTLLPQLGTPEDIGNAAVFLASDEAKFVHGTTVVVDGGWSAHRI